MKRAVSKVLKIIGAVFCGLMAVGGTAAFFSDTSSDPGAVVLIITLVFLGLAVLLIRSIRKGDAMKQASLTSSDSVPSNRPNTPQSKSKAISPYLPEVPPEILRDMKKHYTAVQIQNDVRIMQESFQLVQQTTDFDTFFMRLELSQQKALTLLQAVQAGCRGIANKQQTIKGCEAVLSASQAVKTVFLDNSYQKETASAMRLKTQSGQYKRLTAYLERLKSYEDQFMDAEEAYTQTVNALQGMIAQVQPDSKSSAPRSKQKAQLSSADEIMKFKQLLDAGAITQEEYDAKKKQLLEISSVQANHVT